MDIIPGTNRAKTDASKSEARVGGLGCYLQCAVPCGVSG